MKRALSLIIVLAMVLCMIPFSAFAADWNVGTDFVDGVINLTAENDYEATYLWTATEEGDLEIFAEAVVPSLEEGAEMPELAQPAILVDGADYEGAIHVFEGESYAITIYDQNGMGGDITVRTKFTGLPGTESNPYPWYNPVTGMAPEDQGEATVAVEAGASVYYELWYYAGATLRISGVGVKAVKVFEDKTIDGTEAGYVEFDLAPFERSVLIKITNKSDAAQTYTFESIVPVGTQNNPQVISDGTYTVELAEGNQGYFYSYTAEGDGTVSIEVSAAGTIAGTDAEGNPTERNVGWQYTVNPFAGGEPHWSDDEVVVNPAIVEVTAGQEIIFVVGTYDPYAYGPAGSITTVVSFEEATEEPPVDPPVDPEPEEPPVEEPEVIVIEELPYEATHSGEHLQVYSYTATEAGYLFVTSSDGEDGGYVNFVDVWFGVENYNGGLIYEMAEGDTVQIEVNTPSWGNCEADYTYNFSWITEIEPDGSEAFPFEVGSLLNTTATLTNVTENAVYYVYIAEKDGMIYNSFFESAEPVTAGEKVLFYVPAGGITIYYLPPVAMIGDAEYTSLADAIAAAVAGDTIVLVADTVAEGAYLLPIGVNLDLGANTLTIGGLATFPGSSITGITATIVTDYLVANNVEIDGVEYAWTDSEAGYILTVYKAPVVGTEEPIVAEFGGEQMGLNAALSAAAATNPTADNRAVVTLISDATVDYTVVINPYVTLNIAGYKLTAPNVIGLNGSMINAAVPTATNCTNGGKIIVPTKDNMVMSAELHDGSVAGNKLLPVWNHKAEVGHYLFTNIKNATDTMTEVGGTSGYESYQKCAKLAIKHNWTDSVVKTLINDGNKNVEENALTIVIEASWDYQVIKVFQQYVIQGTYVNTATNGRQYSGDSGEIGDLLQYTLQSQIVSDTGAIFYGNFYNVE